MTGRNTGRLPTVLLRRPVRVLRPQDAAGVYAHPRPEFARLVAAGVLHRLATGYYAVVPDDRIGLSWLPDLESSAQGMAAADEGVASVALMGLSAARVHGALPRAVGVAVVAAARHRATIWLADRDATVVFVRRNIDRIEVERHALELGPAWITTVEQTIVDLAARPDLGGVPDEARAAADALLPRADSDILHRIAAAQRKSAAVNRMVEAGRA